MDLPTIILLLVAISIGATFIAVAVAFRSTREAKSAIFPIVREEEIIRAKRARVSIVVWATITVLLLGGWLASLRLIDSENSISDISSVPVSETAITTPIVIKSPVAAVNINESEPPLTEIVPTNTATTPPTNTPTLLADTPTPHLTNTPVPPADTPTPHLTNTPVPPADTPTPPATNTPAPLTDTPSNTPAPPADTPTLVATDTPISELSATEEATAPANPAPPEAKMGTIEFATEITDKVEAIDPKTIFTNGIDAIYAVFPYSGMTNGLDFKIIWYLNDDELWRDETKWEWGSRYRYYSYFSPYRTGSYKIDVYVNDTILTTGTFEIR